MKEKLFEKKKNSFQRRRLEMYDKDQTYRLKSKAKQQFV